jgi:hypothetical protein
LFVTPVEEEKQIKQIQLSPRKEKIKKNLLQKEK